MGYDRIEIPQRSIAEFCGRWKVRELGLFGSSIRDDFSPDSDVDVLVEFAQGEEFDLFDLVSMKGELESIFHRRVDLVEKRALKNPFRRRAILGACKVIYAA